MFNAIQDSLTLVILGVFFCQILLLSFYLPAKWRRNRRQMFEQHPQSEYPKLYAQPIEVELVRLNIRKYCDLVVGLMAIGLIFYALFGAISLDELAILLVIFSGFQLLPRVISGRWIKQNSRLLKEMEMQAQTHKTILMARQLNHFVSRGYLLIAMIAYAVTVIVGVFLNAQNLWAGSILGLFALLLLNTLVVIYLVWLIYSSLYGQRKDLYQSHADRMTRVGNTIRQCVNFIAFYSLFILLLFLVMVFEFGLAHNYLITSFFLQLILFLQSRQISERDFSVYKADSD